MFSYMNWSSSTKLSISGQASRAEKSRADHHEGLD